MEIESRVRRAVEERRTVVLPPPAVRRARRVAVGLTQRELAEAVSVDRATIARYELGTREPRGVRRQRYLEALEACRDD